MKVVFTQWGKDISCASLMVRSCKALGYEVLQLADEVAPEVAGVDAIQRKPLDAPGMLWRCRRLAEIEPPYVSLDTDMLIVRDIGDGFGTEDVSLSWRERHMIFPHRETVPVAMPYNGGVMFVSNQQFMRDCAAAVEAMPAIRQAWYGDQIALRDVAPRYKVRELRSREWNYAPDTETDIGKLIRVYHFKGPQRKAMMPVFAHRMGLYDNHAAH